MSGLATESEAQSHVRWAAERFYWAILPAPPGVEPRREHGGERGDAGGVPAGLLTDLAEQFPVPIEDVHAVCVASSSGLLVCAALRDELAALPQETRRLTPMEIPAALHVSGDDTGDAAATLNLLVGGFEPRTERVRRTRRHLAGLAVTALVGGLLITGFVRRAAYWKDFAEHATLHADRLVAAALPPGRPPQALPAEVARLQQASLATSKIKPPPDAALALAALLESWPTGAPGTPQSLAVTETGITVSVLIEGSAEGGNDPAQAFLTAFKPPHGWMMHEPRLNSGPDFARIVIDLKPSPIPPPPSSATERDGGVR